MTVHTSKLGQADQPPNRHGIIPCRTSLFFKKTRKSWGRFTYRQGNCIVKQISNVILLSSKERHMDWKSTENAFNDEKGIPPIHNL